MPAPSQKEASLSTPAVTLQRYYRPQGLTVVQKDFKKVAGATLRARKSPARESLERVCATLGHLWQQSGRHQHRYIHRRAPLPPRTLFHHHRCQAGPPQLARKKLPATWPRAGAYLRPEKDIGWISLHTAPAAFSCQRYSDLREDIKRK